MKTILFFFFLLLAAFKGYTQQLNTSGFYEVFTLLHNPAAVGGSGEATIGSSFRKQWSGMPGSPQTGVVFGQAFLPKARLGLGGYLYNDVTGPTSRTGLQMAYAYHIPLEEKTSFSLGLEARLQQLRFDRVKLQQELGFDPVAAGATNRLKADAGFGLAYHSPRLALGAAVSQFVQTNYRLYEIPGTISEQSKFYRHYYLHGNYTLPSDEETKLTPNFLLTYLPNAPLELQAGVRIDHNELFWFGLNRHSRQGWILQAGLKMKKKFSVGYSFEIYNTPLTVYEKGSGGHELMLRYQWLQE